ncbi:NAD-dependent dehydratase [Pseudoroseomonas rhizosphaerae]|uniref:NAD-dependent dehydratase n=1 Tax=Teichococcus rhizosphaerae TaxID=1335062 RepID=A0A2C7A675_9PROT|nr:UDP-glucuronic acid decarboxylase family protein [Pseudoroseomonas rhizosphaerae]PHK93489.1 NAD-dependent dehydratase [Pseudoroseomonas rhizosphaerae]
MSAAKSRNVLVAGGAGFLGSHLCDALIAEGAHVFCVDSLRTSSGANLRHLRRSGRFTFIEADIIDELPAAALPRRLDRVFNLACPASPPQYQADPEHTMMTNVLGTRNLLRLAERHNARFLQASTSEVYGDPEVHPQVETYSGNVSCTGPRACYDEGKRAAEALCFDFDRARRAEIRLVRIFNTYGPRMQPDDGRIVSNVITQALSGADITIYGDGSQTRSFCYVDDLVEGLVRLMAYEGPQPGPVNLGNPNELTVRRLVEDVLAMTGGRSAVTYHPLPKDDPRRRKPDISRAGALLGWAPRTPLAEGLRATLEWFRKVEEPARPSVQLANGAMPLSAAD